MNFSEIFNTTNKLIEYFRDGGILMWPILLCSVLSWAIIIERIVRLRRGRLFDDVMIKAVRKALATSNISAAEQGLESSSALAASVIAGGLEEYRFTEADVETAMHSAAERQLRVLWNNMIALNTIARVATMLGLLGTVVGMVKGFKGLTTNVNKEKLAEAISIALITTVGGMSVAIPAIIGESALRSRIRRLLTAFEEMIFEVIKAVHVGGIPKAFHGETGKTAAVDEKPGKAEPEAESKEEPVAEPEEESKAEPKTDTETEEKNEEKQVEKEASAENPVKDESGSDNETEDEKKEDAGESAGAEEEKK